MYNSSNEMLKDYKKLKALIKQKELDIEELDYDTLGTRGMNYDSERTSPTYKISSETENLAIKREDKINQLRKAKRILEMTIEMVDNARTVLTEQENLLIELRYMKELPCKEVQEEMQQGEKNYFKLHKQAIKKMDEIIFKG